MCPRGSGSRLPALGSSGGATCPMTLAPISRLQAATCSHGSGSCLLARGSSGAATCHLGSSSRLLVQGSSEAATCPKDRLYKLQAIKQISPTDSAIMISIEARVRVSSKALRDKGCFVHSQGVQQAAQ
jgi:hypothetical protein